MMLQLTLIFYSLINLIGCGQCHTAQDFNGEKF